MVQVERGDSSGDQVVLLGDFNALLVSDLESIDAEASPNGKLLADVIKKYQMQVCNFNEKSSGQWTRIQSKKGEEIKSTLDYIIVQSQMFGSLSSFLVDEDKIFTPYREIKERKKQKITYSDHCAIIAHFEVETGKVVKLKGKKTLLAVQ